MSSTSEVELSDYELQIKEKISLLKSLRSKLDHQVIRVDCIETWGQNGPEERTYEMLKAQHDSLVRELRSVSDDVWKKCSK